MVNNLFKKIIKGSKYYNYYLGYKNYENGNLNKALMFVNEVLSRYPTYSPAISLLMSLGIQREDKNIITEAFELFYKKSKIKKLKQSDMLSIASGRVYLKEFSKAKKYLDKVNADKYRENVLIIKAKIAASNMEYNKALKILEEISPFEDIEDPYVLVQIASYMVQLGKIEEALLYLRKVQTKGKKILYDYAEKIIKKYS